MSNQKTPENQPKPTEAAAVLTTPTQPSTEPNLEVKIGEIDYPADPDEAAYGLHEDFDRALEHYGEEGADDFLTAADVERVQVDEAKWIQKAIKNPGGLHRALGVPQGKPIPVGSIRAAAKKGGKTGRMARLALTLRKMRGKKESVNVKPEAVLTSAPMDSKEEVVAQIDAVKQAIADAPVVDLTLGERVVAAIKDGFAALKPKAEEPKPVVEAVTVPAPTVAEKPVEAPKQVEVPKVEEKLKVEEKKEEKPMPDKVEEAGKGVVETEAPDINVKAMTLEEAIADMIRRQVKEDSDGKRSGAYRVNLEKGKVFETNEYSRSNAGSAMPQIWANNVLLTTEKYAVLDKVAVHYDDVLGKPGNKLSIPTVGAVTFADASEAAEATGQAPSTSAITIAINERIAEVKFDKSLAEDTVPSLITQINTAIAQGYEWDFDGQVLGWLNTPATAAPLAGTLAEAGSLQGTCIAKLLGSFRAGTQEPKWLIIHPVQEASLLQDDQFVNASTYGDNSIIKSGRIYGYMGLNIVVTPQVTSTGGTYVGYMLSERAVAVANKRNFAIESYYHPPTRTQYYVATGRYGGTIAIPGQVWKLTTVNG